MAMAMQFDCAMVLDAASGLATAVQHWLVLSVLLAVTVAAVLQLSLLMMKATLTTAVGNADAVDMAVAICEVVALLQRLVLVIDCTAIRAGAVWETVTS